jgi:hypothetical protein
MSARHNGSVDADSLKDESYCYLTTIAIDLRR